MIPNKLKQLWSQGKPTINGWCSIGTIFTAEIMAAQVCDTITIDVQHGALDYSSALPMLQAMGASGVVTAPKPGRPILGAEEFAPVKPGGILASTARGGIMDEAALSAALTEGRVIAAGLDVFHDEPPAQSNPLLDLDQVILTPDKRRNGWPVSSIQNALDFFAGRLRSDLILNKDFRHD
jgi:hypothetical protein